MGRRPGQNPSVRTRMNTTRGVNEYYFQYWVDVAGQERRERRTEVIGLVSQITQSEAERKKLDFIMHLGVNSNEYRIPSSLTFADAVKHNREVFAPRMLRASTFSVAECHLKAHLEEDWNDVPVEHIDIDRVNEWAWRKRKDGLSWVTIKNILRTMQRVLSCAAKDRTPPFSQEGLAISEKDKLRMRIDSRKAVSFSWGDSKRIASAVRKLDALDENRKSAYATAFLLASASGLRCGELFSLKLDDIDFRAGTISVDESAERRLYEIGPCKNAAAYRTILLADREGKEALRVLKSYLANKEPHPCSLLFHSGNGSPLRETNVLHDGLHPALRALGLPQAGMHAFRHGCNRRWELAGLNPAVLRQQMGHTSQAMTTRYTGEVPLEQVRAAFSIQNSNKVVILENSGKWKKFAASA
jgi:integrase